MSTPASRVSDMVFCSVHQNQGHVLEPSAEQVYVGGLPAARYTDICECATSHKSPLAQGAVMVLINGMPAGRVGSKTIDGGEVVQGDESVLVGGDTFTIPSFISIEGDAEYQAKVLRDLYKIAGTTSGQTMFAAMARTGRKVRIHLGERDARTRTDPLRKEPDVGPWGFDRNSSGAYDGTGAEVEMEYDPGATDKNWPPELFPADKSRDATLFHELVHADNIMHGTMDRSQCDNRGGSWPVCLCGERRAVGLPPFEDRSKYPYSENSYREERGYGTRKAY